MTSIVGGSSEHRREPGLADPWLSEKPHPAKWFVIGCARACGAVVEELFFRDEPSALLDQVTKDVKDLRFEVSDSLGPHHFDRVRVDEELAEAVSRHGLSARIRRPG